MSVEKYDGINYQYNCDTEGCTSRTIKKRKDAIEQDNWFIPKVTVYGDNYVYEGKMLCGDCNKQPSDKKPFKFICTNDTCKDETVIQAKDRDEALKMFTEQGFQVAPEKLCPKCANAKQEKETDLNNIVEESKKPTKVKAHFKCTTCGKTEEYETYNEGTFESILRKESNKIDEIWTDESKKLNALGTCYKCVMTAINNQDKVTKELKSNVNQPEDQVLSAGIETYSEEVAEEKEKTVPEQIKSIAKEIEDCMNDDINEEPKKIGKIIQMCVAKNIVYVATESKVYKLEKDGFKPLEFML